MELLQQVCLRAFRSFLLHLILFRCMNCCYGVEAATSRTTIFANETDRLALLAFKQQITQDPLRVMSSWNDSLHFCKWQGVTCGRRPQRVVSLILTSQKLVGYISPYIGNLTFLTFIYLNKNNFQGEIPQQVGHLFRLQELDLSDNSLGGEIPVNLSHCSDLRRIALAFNKLVGKIPVMLGSLLKLIDLSIYSNSITGVIPPSLGNLSYLDTLNLGRNSLEGSIPDSLSRLTTLTRFGIGSNELSGMVPPWLYNLSSLTHLYMTNNHLLGNLPPHIGLTLPNLHDLAIGANQFTGPIPISLSNASELRYLDIQRNNFSGPVLINFGGLQHLSRLNLGYNYLGHGEADDFGFLTSLTNCSNLTTLALYANKFGGMLPNSIANLSADLSFLGIGRNQVVGRIPIGIENLVNLHELSLEQNYFVGTIPISIGKLQRLKIIDLSRNKLSGQIPSSLGNMTQLYQLFLQENNLTGSIPSSLENCHWLQVLNLSQNNLDGFIPKQIIGLSSLLSLNLDHNSLHGSLPVEVDSMKNLGELDISENKLSGEIPNTLGNCLSLERLYMEGNFFHGNIPPSLSSLRAIQDLDLSRNNLSGRIPRDLATLSLLQSLNLSFNDLEGEVPTEGVFRNASAITIAGNIKLCGGILKLQLPACPIQEFKKRGRPPSFKVKIMIASAVVCLTLIASFVTLYWRRKSRRKPLTTSTLADRHLEVSYRHLRVSYGELLKATDGFSASSLIGIGSYGSVYKGVLDQDGTIVAVKVLNLQRRGASKSFISECKALRSVRHRNLLQILTSCSSVDFQGNDFKAIVFEFMSNGNLGSWLHPSVHEQRDLRNLSLIQRLNIAIDVASAMEYLHHHCQTTIVHSDLKPSNVLLDSDMIAHVGDFGLAKVISAPSNDSEQNQTSSVAIKGSVGYIAPEYGMGGEVSTYGDVYSYGILLLEMFTGKRPTDDMFKEGLSLHNFAKMALPERVKEIVDPHLLLEEEEDDETSSNIKNQSKRRHGMWECLVSVFKIGVACSVESPRERMDMKDVFVELLSIRDIYL